MTFVASNKCFDAIYSNVTPETEDFFKKKVIVIKYMVTLDTFTK